ncbi:MAG: outer membrane lipoprotein-sorting protein, partial [Terracidiphilus sp.]
PIHFASFAKWVGLAQSLSVIFALFLTAFAVVPARAATANAVLAAPRQRVETADFRASGHLVRVDANGVRSSDGISIRAHWFPGVLRVVVEITSPPAARQRVLIGMRPDGRNSILVARPGDRAPVALAFDKWSDGPLGSAFSYEDFLEPEYFWPGQTVTEQTKYGARLCNVLKSTPGPDDRTHYAEIKSWLDSSIGFPVYVEKTVKGTGLVKEFTYLGLRHDGGVWSAAQVEVKIRGRAGSTLLIIDRGSPKAHLTLNDFSPALLTRF